MGVDNVTVEEGFKRLAEAINSNSQGGSDAAGGYVGCLTESVMGNTAGLVRIAKAINNLAEAVRETANPK